MTDTSLMTGLDAISASLGAATPITTIPRPESKEIVKVEEAREIEDDYQEARANIKELIGQMMEQVPELINLTQQSQSDKMYNAAANFINAAANLNLSLSKLSKEIKRVPAPKGSSGSDQPTAPQQITQNNVYVGSTEDFLAMMEDRKNVKSEKPIDSDYVEVET